MYRSSVLWNYCVFSVNRKGSWGLEGGFCLDLGGSFSLDLLSRCCLSLSLCRLGATPRSSSCLGWKRASGQYVFGFLQYKDLGSFAAGRSPCLLAALIQEGGPPGTTRLPVQLLQQKLLRCEVGACHSGHGATHRSERKEDFGVNS